MKLTDRKENVTLDPAPEDISAAFEDVINNPESEDGYTSISIEAEDGWKLTSYGNDLVIMDHEDGQNNLPSHLADLKYDHALEVLKSFGSGGDVNDYNWKVGYGPT